MESLTIGVNKQLDGFTFSLAPIERQSLKREFPDASPVASIFVAYDTKASLEALYGRIRKYIFPALVGVDKDDELKKIKHINFVDPASKQILYTM